MACGSCGARKAATDTEYLVSYRDPNRADERVKDMTMARRLIAVHGGGTYKLVAKQTK